MSLFHNRYSFGPSYIFEQLGESWARKDKELQDKKVLQKKMLNQKKYDRNRDSQRDKKTNDSGGELLPWEKYGIPIVSVMGAILMAGCFVVFAVAALVVSAVQGQPGISGF